MELIQEYIKPELLILIPVLYLVGIAIKKSEKVSDKYIPSTLGMVGVILSALYLAATVEVFSYQETLLLLFTALTQGVLCAGASVYVNQLIKQSGKDE